ncbi:SWIM zinc finger family protein [Streptomyces phaeochromogenes]|uniref:SWIM zinc finger family protein n=1 Tax=Streptomyces phaeochromogenes TaxID=1923 RepID=UPI0033FB5E42
MQGAPDAHRVPDAGDAHRVPDVGGGEGSEPDVESSAPGRSDAAAGSPRPGDVAREALRAARIQAERERTAARDKGVEGRRRRTGAESGTPTPRPTMTNRRAAAQVRELADRLGDAFDLTARLEREESEDRPTRPDAAPGSASPAAVPTPEDQPAGWPASRPTPAVTGPVDTDTATAAPDAAQASVDDQPPSTEPKPGLGLGPDPELDPTQEPDRGPAPRPKPKRGPAPAPSSNAAAAPTGGSIADAVRAAMARAARDPDTDEPDSTTTPAPHSGATPTTPAPHADAAPDPAAPHPTPAQLPIAAPARSMAAPGRDGELRRTFPALPARPQGADGFAETWWGNAWVAALEEAALDAARLGRGKAYARAGHVDAITVTPGLVLAYVHGSRPRPYRVQIRMRTLSDDDWERFLDAAAERPGHIAALLDKDLPQSLADSGVGLLPGPGDLVPQCSCPDSGHPCKHAAALCYQTARLLDEDPFVLLLSRGRGERELLDALSRRSATLAARSARAEQEPALPGVRATDALAPRTLPPLPAPLPPPAHPEQPPVYPASPGGPDPFALDQLATDAAARAHALLTTGRDPVAELTLWQDAVRLAATRPGSGLTATTRALYASLATAAGRTPAELARAVAAWRQGGLEGLAVLEEPWDPPAGRFDRARPLLLAADFPAFRPWHNHLTHPRGHIQLRLGHDGLWYAYESEPGHDDWWPRGTPDLDPVGALTGLGSPTDL